MNNPKVIHIDVGCWQSHESEEPVQTFVLIEHNTIALCTYYSNGEKLYSPPFLTKEFEYDFKRTLTAKFLNGLLLRKYGKNVIPFLGSWSSPNAKDFHIKKLITFPRCTLLDDEQKLVIFIPDTHLHYFKMSYLDNFVTWFSNEWSLAQGRPIGKRLQNRISMEDDFSTFLEYISEFQKKDRISTRVYILGDLTEMWETKAGIENFKVKKPGNLYKGLQSQIEWLNKNVEAKGKLSRFLKDLHSLKIDKAPYDSVFLEQISSLKKETLEKLLVRDNESGDSLKTKAKYLEKEILKKYKNQKGKHFGELFENINSKIRVHGNHDNFGYIKSTNPLYSFSFGFAPQAYKFRSNYIQKKTEYLVMHGHSLDPHNNDAACGVGYLIVNILNLFEAKKRGDLLKKYESVLVGDAHLDYIKRLLPIFYDWEKGNINRIKKNKVVVQAHTHSPYLKDITDHYKKYSSPRFAIRSAILKRKIIKKYWRSRLGV